VQFEFNGTFDPNLFVPNQPAPASGEGIGRRP
jgi:hypothetical protein